MKFVLKHETCLLILPKDVDMWALVEMWIKTHYYRAPFNFTHFALGDDNAYITGADTRSK